MCGDRPTRISLKEYAKFVSKGLLKYQDLLKIRVFLKTLVLAIRFKRSHHRKQAILYYASAEFRQNKRLDMPRALCAAVVCGVLGAALALGQGLPDAVDDGPAGPSASLVPGPSYHTQFEVLKAGRTKGYSVVRGDRVTVHATGRFKETGNKFFSTKVAVIHAACAKRLHAVARTRADAVAPFVNAFGNQGYWAISHHLRGGHGESHYGLGPR